MRRALRLVRYVVAVLLGLAALAYAVTAVKSFWQAPSFDPDDRCHPGQTGPCLTRVRGIVEEPGIPEGIFADVKVRYDDGRRTAGLVMAEGSPRVGTRVWLETWDGEHVAVFDPSTEVRFRTIDWPVRWNGRYIVWTFVALALGAACWPWRRRITRSQADA